MKIWNFSVSKDTFNYPVFAPINTTSLGMNYGVFSFLCFFMDNFLLLTLDFFDKLLAGCQFCPQSADNKLFLETKLLLLRRLDLFDFGMQLFLFVFDEVSFLLQLSFSLKIPPDAGVGGMYNRRRPGLPVCWRRRSACV